MPRENVCSSCGTENETDEYVCRTCQRRLSALPRWARSSRAAGSAKRKTWALRLAAGLALATLAWFNYPYVPNPIIWLKAPSSNLTSVSSPEKWSMRGANPDGSGYIAGTSPALKGEIVQTYDLGVATRSSPAIVEGVVYIGGDFKVTAFDGNDGEPKWETPTAGPVHGTPAVAGQNLYVPLQDKRLLALDLKSGAIRWEFDSDSPLIGSVAVDGGIVYAAAQGRKVYAIDAESGRQIWKLDVGSSVVQPPAVYRGKVVAGSSAGNIFVQNARTGDKRLRIRTGSLLAQHPVIGNDRIYVLSDGDLLAFDANARELPGEYPLNLVWAQLWIWQVPVPSPPAQPGFEWRVSLPRGMGDFLVAPAATPEGLYLGSDLGGIYAMDPLQGDILWQFQTPAAMLMQPIVIGQSLYFGTADGALYAVNRFSGQTEWNIMLDAPMSGPLSFASGRLYAHTTDGRLNIIR